MPLRVATIDALVDRQTLLIDALCDRLGTTRSGVLETMNVTKQPVVLRVAEQNVAARRHGLGISFSGKGTPIVDMHARPDDPSLVDVHRVLVWETPHDWSRGNEVYEQLVDLCKSGALVCLDATERPSKTSLYRRTTPGNPCPKLPWSYRESRGGFVELQRGPHKGEHWRSDSLFLDWSDTRVFAHALQVALGKYDPFAMYEDIGLDAAMEVMGQLQVQWTEAATLSADTLAGPDYNYRATRGFPIEQKRQYIADVAHGLSNWISATISNHGSFSILGP